MQEEFFRLAVELAVSGRAHKAVLVLCEPDVQFPSEKWVHIYRAPILSLLPIQGRAVSVPLLSPEIAAIAQLRHLHTGGYRSLVRMLGYVTVAALVTIGCLPAVLGRPAAGAKIQNSD